MSGTDLPRRVRLDESVRVRVGPDQGFLFDQRTGRVYSLNASAAFAAARLQEAPVAAVVAAVVETFDVDEAVAREDLARLVGQLLEEGLAHAEE